MSYRILLIPITCLNYSEMKIYNKLEIYYDINLINKKNEMPFIEYMNKDN